MEEDAAWTEARAVPDADTELPSTSEPLVDGGELDEAGSNTAPPEADEASAAGKREQEESLERASALHEPSEEQPMEAEAPDEALNELAEPDEAGGASAASLGEVGASAFDSLRAAAPAQEEEDDEPPPPMPKRAQTPWGYYILEMHGNRPSVEAGAGWKALDEEGKEVCAAGARARSSSP